MKRSIRWIPAKVTAAGNSLGQAIPVSIETTSAPTPEPVKNPALMTNLMYGGLILAGLALVWAVMVGPEPDPARSWQ